MPQTVRADVSRGLHIGVQSTFGTPATANLQFPSMQFARPKPQKKSMRPVKPSTFKVPTSVVGGKENVMWDATSDGITYDEMAYVMETCIKHVTATNSSGAWTRIITPSISSQDTRRLLTVEDGQTGNFWSAQDAFFQGFNLKSSPDSVDFAASVMGADISIPSAFSQPSATTINNKPILVERVGVFNAGSFAGLTSPTALDNALECELDFSTFIDAYYRLKQGERSYAGTVEVVPQLKVNLTCAMDQSAQEISGAQFTLAQWRAGTVTFLRWQAKTTDFISGSTTWELTFDMCLLVGEPFTLVENQGVSAVTWPCVVAADNNGNWLSIKLVSTVADL